jgi:hypothetical protein
MATSKVDYLKRKTIDFTLFCFLFRSITWPEVRMAVANSFLSQGHRPTSANKTHSKDDWLRQVKQFLIFSISLLI